MQINWHALPICPSVGGGTWLVQINFALLSYWSVEKGNSTMLSTKNIDRILLGRGLDAIASDPLHKMFYICTQRWIEQFPEIWQSGSSHKSLIVDDQDQTTASPQVFLKLLFLNGPYGLCTYVYKGEIALLKQDDMIKIVDSTFIHTSEAVYLHIYIHLCQ